MDTAMLRGEGAGRGSSSHPLRADDATAPGLARGTCPPRHTSTGTRTRIEARRTPRVSRPGRWTDLGRVTGRAVTPTGFESRTGVSRPDAPTRLAVRVRRLRTPCLPPGRPGYATRKATPPREQGPQQAGRDAPLQTATLRDGVTIPPGTPAARAATRVRHRQRARHVDRNAEGTALGAAHAR